MGFWNKLGKIALQAAPYVAAPFTGGASLLATGATQKLGQKWAESDANKAAAKGLGPSSFDHNLLNASGLASLGSSVTGGFGGKLSGGKNTRDTGFLRDDIYNTDQRIRRPINYGDIDAPPGPVRTGGDQGGGWQDTLKRILGGSGGGGISTQGRQPDGSYRINGTMGPITIGGVGSNQSGYPNGGFAGGFGTGGGGWQDALAAIFNPGQGGGPGNPNNGGGVMYSQGTGGAVPRNSQMRGLGPIMGAMDQNNPNLAMSIGQGRQEAIRNQPWRGGYDIRTQGDDGSVINSSVPSIVPNMGARRRMNPAAEMQ